MNTQTKEVTVSLGMMEVDLSNFRRWNIKDMINAWNWWRHERIDKFYVSVGDFGVSSIYH